MDMLTNEILDSLTKDYYIEGLNDLCHLHYVITDANFKGFPGEPEIFLNEIIPGWQYIRVYKNKEGQNENIK